MLMEENEEKQRKDSVAFTAQNRNKGNGLLSKKNAEILAEINAASTKEAYKQLSTALIRPVRVIKVRWLKLKKKLTKDRELEEKRKARELLRKAKVDQINLTRKLKQLQQRIEKKALKAATAAAAKAAKATAKKEERRRLAGKAGAKQGKITEKIQAIIDYNSDSSSSSSSSSGGSGSGSGSDGGSDDESDNDSDNDNDNNENSTA
jgi:hypothetical protein